MDGAVFNLTAFTNTLVDLFTSRVRDPPSHCGEEGSRYNGEGPPLAAGAVLPGEGVVTWMGLKISDALGAGGNVSEGKCRSDCLRESGAPDCSPSNWELGSNHLTVGIGRRMVPVDDKGMHASGTLPGV